MLDPGNAPGSIPPITPIDQPISPLKLTWQAPIPSPSGELSASQSSSGINDSGQGATAVLPRELKGFNWGGFLLTWIWAIGHSTWVGLIAMLIVIPYVGWLLSILFMIWLGLEGNKYAWKNRKWDNVQQFKDTQKAWAKWGIIVWVASLVLLAIFVLILLLGSFVETTAYSG